MIEVEFYYNPKFKEINQHFSSGFNNYFGSIKTCKFPTRSSFLKTLKKHEFTNYGAMNIKLSNSLVLIGQIYSRKS